jgi:hypothetical protein
VEEGSLTAIRIAEAKKTVKLGLLRTKTHGGDAHTLKVMAQAQAQAQAKAVKVVQAGAQAAASLSPVSAKKARADAEAGAEKAWEKEREEAVYAHTRSSITACSGGASPTTNELVGHTRVATGTSQIEPKWVLISVCTSAACVSIPCVCSPAYEVGGVAFGVHYGSAACASCMKI